MLDGTHLHKELGLSQHLNKKGKLRLPVDLPQLPNKFEHAFRDTLVPCDSTCSFADTAYKSGIYFFQKEPLKNK